MRRNESNQTKENQPKPPDKSAWCKITFPFTKPQYMLGVLKRPISSRWLLSPQTVWCVALKNLTQFNKHKPDLQVKVIDAKPPFLLPKDPSPSMDSFEHPKHFFIWLIKLII